MPSFKKSPARAATPARKPGSKSPKHRGYRPPETASAPAKKRWTADDRARRAGTASTDRRPDWQPGGGASRPARAERFERGERGGRPARAERTEYTERAGRPENFKRAERDGRASRADRADRAGRAGRAGHAGWPERTDRTERAARQERGGYAERHDRQDRAGHEHGSYASRAERTDRPGRQSRTDRSAYTDRPARTDRLTRTSGFDRAERRSHDSRPQRTEHRNPTERRQHGDRQYSERQYGDRPHSDRQHTDRPRRDSDFYPAKENEQRFSAHEDVVLERLEAEAIQASAVEGMTFTDLGLGKNIVRGLENLGATSPFPIQAATIPDVLKGRDVLGRGKTGSGKTIAFGAPLVERLMENFGAKGRKPGRAPRALILAPTRELALQIDRTVQPIARSVGLFTTQIYGGVPQHRQVTALQRGVDIVIGTPGRIEDLIEQGRLDLSQVTVTVIDEADHMCDLGFLEPVQRILRGTSPGGQKLLFSATLDTGVASLVDEFLVDPTVHEVAGEDQASSTIDHRVLLIEQRDKRAIIEQLAAGEGKTLIFARTRTFAEELAEDLSDAGIPAVSLHGDLNQARRTRNLERLTSGRVRVLVATDVAARGIHVDDISLVIQADPPDEYKSYLHRAGRTGRAGKAGTVVTLVNARRRRKMDELLGRAEITPRFDAVRPGDELIDTLAAL